jgi:muconolactone delta-isomerase
MKFMVEGTFKEAPTPEMMGLIPAEIARGRALQSEGVRVAIYVAADLSKSWQVFDTASEAALQDALATLPLTPYVSYRITPLEEES